MVCSLGETLAVLRDHIPESLVPTPQLRRIEVVARILRGAASSYYLECHLEREAPRVDLLACVTASDHGREGLLADMVNAGIDQMSLWSGLFGLLVEWARRGSPLNQCVPHLWLGFDLVGDESTPVPNVLFCLVPEYFSRATNRTPPPIIARHDYLAVIDAISKLLPCAPDSPQANSSLTASYDQLPSCGELLHLSVMFSRTPRVYKLNIALPTEHLLDYLNAIRWPGTVTCLEELFVWLQPFPERAKFQLTIDQTIQPSIELELHFDHTVTPFYQKVLQWAVDKKLCSQEQRVALLAWPGTFRAVRRGHSWPTRWYKWSDIKLICRPPHAMAAKAYLGFMPSSSICLLYTSPSPRDLSTSRMPSSA